ncbi:MAG: hypothetical protein HRT37_07015 [Alteromonadaceae bacterium]|nr:hypothetical protein [Alteromonadaceae bacterium]
MSNQQLLVPILKFLKYETSDEWIEKAANPENLQVILVDHLLCELNVNMCKLSFSD